MRILQLLTIVVLLFSCRSKFEKTLESRDIEKKEKMAFSYYEKENYFKAADLFKSLIQDMSGGEEIEKMFFYYAMCDYKMGDFGLAAYEFERLIQKFPRGVYTEEAQFLIGMANYKKAPPSYLDQDYTYRAIESFQLFLDKYPESDKREEVNNKVDELTKRLEKKLYDQAMLYYNMGEYKSSSVAFESLLIDFPDSRHAEEASFLIADSHFKLANQSIESKQIERYRDAEKSAQLYKVKFKDGAHFNKADDITEKSKEEITRLKKELPEYYHRIGRYDLSIGLYETLFRRARKLEEQQQIAVNMFRVYHTKAQKARTEYKLSAYKELMKFYNDLNAPNKNYVKTTTGKEFELAQLGYQQYQSTAAFQLYKEGKYKYSLDHYKDYLNDTSFTNKPNDWYFMLLANYKYLSDLEAAEKNMQLDSMKIYYRKALPVLEAKDNNFKRKASRLMSKVSSEKAEFPAKLVEEPFKEGRYKVAIGRAQQLLSRKLSQENEEEIVYLLIATAAKYAKKGKRFERFDRFSAADKYYEQYVSLVKSEDKISDLKHLKEKIDKGLIKYQIKEE